MNESMPDRPEGGYRMVALDLDGTLLQSDHQIAEEQVEYLRQLHSAGVTICIATGRAAPSLYEHVQRLALPEPIPVVCSNGARGFFLASDTTLPTEQRQQEVFYTPVTLDVTRKTIQLASELGYCIQYYLDDAIYANPTSPAHVEMMQQYTAITQNPILPVEDDFQDILGSHDETGTSGNGSRLPSKLLVRFGSGQIEKAHRAFLDLLSPSNGERMATIIRGFLPSTDWFLEILHPDVNKGHGLRRMCEKLDVPMNCVVAMGDGTNDIEFLKLAGLGIAMKNAHVSLQDEADYTTEWTNDEQGVRKTLERLQSCGQLKGKD